MLCIPSKIAFRPSYPRVLRERSTVLSVRFARNASPSNVAPCCSMPLLSKTRDLIVQFFSSRRLRCLQPSSRMKLHPSIRAVSDLLQFDSRTASTSRSTPCAPIWSQLMSSEMSTLYSPTHLLFWSLIHISSNILTVVSFLPVSFSGISWIGAAFFTSSSISSKMAFRSGATSPFAARNVTGTLAPMHCTCVSDTSMHSHAHTK